MATTTQTYGNLTAEQKTFYDRTLLSEWLICEMDFSTLMSERFAKETSCPF